MKKKFLSLIMLCSLFAVDASMLSKHKPHKTNNSIKIENEHQDCENIVNSYPLKIKKQQKKNESKLKYAIGIPVSLSLLAFAMYKTYKSCKTKKVKPNPIVEQNFENMIKNLNIDQECQEMIFLINKHLLSKNFSTAGFKLNKNDDTYKLITEWLENKGYKISETPKSKDPHAKDIDTIIYSKQVGDHDWKEFIFASIKVKNFCRGFLNEEQEKNWDKTIFHMRYYDSNYEKGYIHIDTSDINYMTISKIPRNWITETLVTKGIQKVWKHGKEVLEHFVEPGKGIQKVWKHGKEVLEHFVEPGTWNRNKSEIKLNKH